MQTCSWWSSWWPPIRTFNSPSVTTSNDVSRKQFVIDNRSIDSDTGRWRLHQPECCFRLPDHLVVIANPFRTWSSSGWYQRVSWLQVIGTDATRMLNDLLLNISLYWRLLWIALLLDLTEANFVFDYWCLHHHINEIFTNRLNQTNSLWNPRR